MLVECILWWLWHVLYINQGNKIYYISVNCIMGKEKLNKDVKQKKEEEML